MKMKNKNAEQVASKKQHKAGLKEAKRRREQPLLEVPPPTNPERQTILIVCEGINTEPAYFR